MDKPMKQMETTYTKVYKKPRKWNSISFIVLELSRHSLKDINFNKYLFHSLYESFFICKLVLNPNTEKELSSHNYSRNKTPL